MLLLSSQTRGQVFYYITDSRDGQEYKVVHIDDLWWMAENLNVGTRIDARLDDQGQQRDNDTIEKYCYNNNESYCDKYGGLYQWDELMQYGNIEFYHGICPSGWHVSTDEKWKQLEAYLGMSSASVNDTGFRGVNEGGMLKSTGITDWEFPNGGATNTVGFNALPGGFWDITGNFNFEGIAAYFWNAETNMGDPFFRGLNYYDGTIYRMDTLRNYGASARCIKDSPYIFGLSTMTDPRDGKEYKTVLIENHWWMAENLNIGTRIDAGALQTDFGGIQKYCYQNQEAYCDTFGGIYQWDEAMNQNPNDNQGICPDGWHVPTDENWMELEYAAGMNEDVLNYKSCRGQEGGIFLQEEGGSGFNVKLGGGTDYYGDPIDLGKLAYFWTSSETNDELATERAFQKDYSCIGRYSNLFKSEGISLRCVCNDDEILSLSIEAADTVCAGQETTLQAKTSGGTGSKSYYWWSNTSTYQSEDSILKVKPNINDNTFFVRVIDGRYTCIIKSIKMFVHTPDDFSITGDISVCPTDEQVGYSVTSNSSYNYSWDISDEGVGTLFSSDEDHALYTWGTTSGYGYIEVTATEPGTGCSAKKIQAIEVMQSPKPEVILKGNSLLICTDSGQIYQWYHEGNVLNKATRQFYYAKGNETGNYTVEITWDNDCRNFSNPRTLTKKSTADPGFDESQTVFIHPNPTDGNIILEMISEYSGSLEITVTSSTGRIVKQQRLNKFNPVYSTSLELEGLAEGSYILAVEYGGIREVQRITIRK